MINKTYLHPIRTSDYSNSVSSYYVLTSHPHCNKISPYSKLKLAILNSGIFYLHTAVLKIVKLPSTGDKKMMEKVYVHIRVPPHSGTRRRDDVVTTSLCTSQRRCRYISNKTPNKVSMERCQGVPVLRLHDVLLVCCDDVLWGRNDDVLSVRLYHVSNKFQIEQPTTSQWHVTKTFQWYVSTMSH